MAYKENIHYKQSDLNSSTVTINGDHKVQSLHSIKYEFTDPRSTVFMADDGTGQKVKNNKRDGLVTLEIHKASPSNKFLWDLFYEDEVEGISIEHTDSNMPDMKNTAPHASVATAPVESKSGTPEMVVWTFNEIYLDIKGDGQALIA